MATKLMRRHPIGMAPRILPSIINSSFQRTFSSSQRPISLKCSSAQIRPCFSRWKLQQSFRRSYADSLPPKPRRRAGFFRWTWRLTYLSALGGIGYLGYTIYLLRTPQEQFEPDPSKKTLVILGMLQILLRHRNY